MFKVGEPKWKNFIFSVIYILIFDAFWLGFAKTFGIYPLNNLPKQQWKIIVGALIAYIPLAIAVSCLEADSLNEAAEYGAFIGVLTYAVFNGTELAIRSDWWEHLGGAVPIIDMSWGTFNLTVNSILVYLTINALQ